jgi:tetratricopeptide (TPR) repeat protein
MKQISDAHALEDAIHLHRQGHLDLAQEIYRSIISGNANHFDALHLIGVCYQQQGAPLKAIEFIQKAILTDCSQAPAYNNLGLAQKSLKQFHDAIASFNKAIELKPDYVDALCNLGNLLKDQSCFHEAIQSYQQALLINPNLPDAQFNLGCTLQQLNLFDRAIESYQKTLSLNPSYIQAHINIGSIFHKIGKSLSALDHFQNAADIDPNSYIALLNLGTVQQHLQNHKAAITSFEKAIVINPTFFDAYFNCGNTLLQMGQFEQAIKCFDQALARNQDHADCFFNLGNAYMGLKEYEKAIKCFDQALLLKPELKEAHNHKGVAWHELLNLRFAIDSFKKALNIDPSYADAHLNSAYSFLLNNDYENGFIKYEWRWKVSQNGIDRSQLNIPLWLGKESVNKKIILIYAEQGLGDTIQFIRYINLVAQYGAKVILQIQPLLINVFDPFTLNADIQVIGEPIKSIDFQIPLLSLPLAFNTNLENIPVVQKCISIDPMKKMLWGARLGEKKCLRIGLAYSGSASHKDDKERSISLTELLGYLPEGFDYVCLQKEILDADLQLIHHSKKMRQFKNEIIDFSDTAALIDCMDLIISVDTSIAHLAGTLSKPTWLLLAHRPDWRWQLEKNCTPWYSSFELIRQNTRGSWGSVLASVRENLNHLKVPEATLTLGQR